MVFRFNGIELKHSDEVVRDRENIMFRFNGMELKRYFEGAAKFYSSEKFSFRHTFFAASCFTSGRRCA